MPVFNTQRDLSNGERYDKVSNIRMTEMNNSETNGLLRAHKSNTDADFRTHALTQEEVGEQIKEYISPFTKQLEVLTRPIPMICILTRAS